MPLFENFRIPGLSDPGQRRNFLASVVAGALVSIGWWLIIDIAARYPSMEEFNHAYYTCGVFSTISMLMINIVTNGQLRGDSYTDGCVGHRGAKAWLFIGFVLGFMSLIASCWILFQSYVIPGKVPMWPGVGLFLQNAFVFIGSLVFKFGRSEDNWG